MKVEHEKRLASIFLSLQRLRSGAGTRLRMAWAKSALITTASAACAWPSARTPMARRPSNSSCSTGAFNVKRTPMRRANLAIVSMTALQPPIGCQMPCSCFEKRQDGEEARAAVRRHAEVLALERERQPNARILEIARQLPVDAGPRPKVQKPACHRRVQQVEHGLGLARQGPARTRRASCGCRRESGRARRHRRARRPPAPVSSGLRQTTGEGARPCRRGAETTGGTSDRGAAFRSRRAARIRTSERSPAARADR